MQFSSDSGVWLEKHDSTAAGGNVYHKLDEGKNTQKERIHRGVQHCGQLSYHTRFAKSILHWLCFCCLRLCLHVV